MLRQLVLILNFFLFALFTCFVSWSHQNKEVISEENSDSDAWYNFRKESVIESDLVAFYSFQDEMLKYGSIRNRKKVLPTTLRDIKPAEGKIIGRIVSTRWPGKQGLELDQESIRLPVTDVAGESFTVSFWIRQNGLGKVRGANFDAAASLIALGDGIWNGWRIDLLSPSNRVVFQLATPRDRKEAGVCGSLRIPPKTWTHVAVSRDPKRIRLYVNGLLSGEREHDLLPTKLTPTNSLKIGYAGNGLSSSSFQIDELCIWSTARKPFWILCDSLYCHYSNENIEQIFDEASTAFCNRAHLYALSLYEECLKQDSLPAPMKSAIQFRCGEIHAVLGNTDQALRIYSDLSTQNGPPCPIKSHSMHNLLYLQEQQKNPLESELSYFSVANSLLYGELSAASTNYTNAMIEYDFLSPVK